MLGGTGLVEAGTYIAILGGTILGGILVLQRPDGSYHAEWAAVGVLIVAVIGRIAGGFVPPAPPAEDTEIPGYPHRGMDWHIVRASITLVSATLHVRRLFLAILSISFFWAMGAVLAAQFPPLVKNIFHADQSVATLFLAVFSVGVAIGSVAINRMLKGNVSARFAPASALMMGVFVLLLYILAKDWTLAPELVGTREFLRHPLGWAVVARPAGHRHCRRHVRGAALRLPDDHRSQIGNGTNGGREQYRQLRRDGRRNPDPDRARPSSAYRWRRRCSWSRSPA